MSVQAGSHPTRSRRRAWPALDRALAPHRVGSVTLGTTFFYTIVFVHLVVRVLLGTWMCLTCQYLACSGDSIPWM